MSDLVKEYKEKMNQISDIKDRLSSMQNDVLEENKRLNKELSQCDLMISDIYHYIELGKYNAVEGWKLLSKLKDILRKRREIKNDFETTQCILMTSFGKRIDAIKNLSDRQKSYKLKTDILDGLVKDIVIK